MNQVETLRRAMSIYLGLNDEGPPIVCSLILPQAVYPAISGRNVCGTVSSRI